jgi:hypothetical protein
MNNQFLQEFIKKNPAEGRIEASKNLRDLNNIPIIKELKNSETDKKVDNKPGARIRINKEYFGESGDTILQNLTDALVALVIIFIITTESFKDLISKFITGMFTFNEQRQKYGNGGNEMLIVQNTKKLTLKGKLILGAVFCIAFIVIKTWFIHE